MRVGLVGLGFMGRAHMGCYQKMANKGEGATLVAICDVDEKKLSSCEGTAGNLSRDEDAVDLSKYTHYTCMEEMIKKESLDYVDICLPTHLHAPMSIKAMEMGVHVFCEKPMARSSALCADMIAASKRTGKKLMIGQCLRYWDVYQLAKQYVESGMFGKCIGAYFYRGGTTPTWSWENWLLQNELSGGCLLDQHVHDIDAIVWMFGLPKAVSTAAINVIPGSGYDVVSTNYMYENGPMVNAQDDWTINGEGYNFEMLYRINFERGTLVFEKGRLMVHPADGTSFQASFEGRDAYYDELLLFTDLLKNENAFDYISLLESHRQTMIVAEAEERSANNGGALERIMS